MKIVKKGPQPLSDHEFAKIKYLAEEVKFIDAKRPGSIIDKKKEALVDYIERILSFVNLKSLKPLKIVINSGNGVAGRIIDTLKSALEQKATQTNFIYVNHEPDASFPQGIPNPLIKENRRATSDVVIQEKADFGVAFDGDFDRCFLFDHLGNFISGEYVVGLLAGVFLGKDRGTTIVHDPRVIWNTKDVVNKYKGYAVVTKTGHSFMKAAMIDAGAVYGGEMSAHHYFRDFSYCDSGMIPWLIVWQILSEKKMSLYELIFDRKYRFPSSVEVFFIVHVAEKCLQKLKDLYFQRLLR